MPMQKSYEIESIPAFSFKIEYAECYGVLENRLSERSLKEECALFVIKEAYTSVLIDNVLYSLNAGDVLCLPPFRFLLPIDKTKPLRFYRILLPASLLNRFYPLLLADASTRKSKLLTQELKEDIYTLCEDLLSEKEGALYKLFSLLEICNASRAPYTEIDEEIESYEVCLPLSLRKAMLYMINHLKSPLTQEVVAKENGLSSAKLTQLFKDHLHVSFKDYLSYLRMQSASELLFCLSSLDAVRDALKYTSSSRFSSDFKEVFGVTPSGYLKNSGLVKEPHL